ncbi:hypothetical protein SERLA73DRAFT_176691 [Serpula lacrymans var. lacrymans S7.3]|uniref:Methylated-DNA--protein-cysteine methyltransferase n=2 Tax=Serpula lacrymans var. lacrymans TaxID=341189 RepID=F8PPK3_SERL3|nr:uncharacterized protein SERLADRAFT_459853 [Serpula lacrymans var. lacrymans S7.9]EGO01422.1 hypothetical protein SERLA73DRAFT_176691 [Serpula lacrymans var. lacrymans S7.3]EGO27052.1 hypothetical protein SERLADRAFT_459853 [Serpula lacrymans var. lacrymans S7.9]
MPAIRTTTGNKITTIRVSTFKTRKSVIEAFTVSDEPQDLAVCNIKYPLTASERASYKTAAGKHVTPHRWEVYDYVRTIPVGRVTTYKDICLALGEGSPRTIGSALRNNPFAPFVPCHRIVASNLYIGGFYGEWGVDAKSKDGKTTGLQCNRKMEMLAKEGVKFTRDGYLYNESYIWRG